MIPQDPAKVWLMDPEKFIKDNNCKEVTSFAIYEPSETVFHAEGLFSEQIFGQLGTVNRLITFGFINLHTKIFHPNIFLNIVKLGTLYADVMASKSYAKLNEETGELELATAEEEGARTGFQFMTEIFPKIEYKLTESEQRKLRIDVISKYDQVALFSKFPVLPAGVRDIKSDTGMKTQEEINKLYRTVLAYSVQIPENTTSDIYDNFRYILQQKIVEIYKYIFNILDGKKGWLRGVYGKRYITGGTRNVFSAPNYIVRSPNDPQYLHFDEVGVGTYNAIKANQLISLHILKRNFFEPIFRDVGNTIALVNRDTYKLEYFEVPERELKKFDNDEAIVDWINKFRNVDLRANPITVNTVAGPQYALLVHDTGKSITIFQNIDDVQQMMPDKFMKEFVRPLTWIELFYMVAVQAYLPDKHGFVTRYPVIEDGGCFPAKPIIGSTTQSRVVSVYSGLSGMEKVKFTHYPILGKNYQDTIILHACRLAGLGADFDGDTGSFNVVVGNDTNAEIREYYQSAKSIIDVRKKLFVGPNTDNIEWTFMNMTRIKKDSAFLRMAA